MANTYEILTAEVKRIDAEISRLQDKRKAILTTAAFFVPKETSTDKAPTERKGVLKDQVTAYLEQYGPTDVPTLATQLKVPHSTSVHRAVSQLEQAGKVVRQDDRKIAIRGEGS